MACQAKERTERGPVGARAAELASKAAIGPMREGERGAVQRLLTQADLPVQGLEAVDFLVARLEGAVVGAIGMERRGEDALFRSLVVDPAWRGNGLGERLHTALAQLAKASGVRRAFLLTSTIAELAATWGYRAIDRGQMPAEVAQTWEVASGCCRSATAMTREL
jgi:amino-acid N-acetyltransferase